LTHVVLRLIGLSLYKPIVWRNFRALRTILDPD
jgi:hypothetical protein